MKILAGFVLAVAAIATIGLSNETSSAKLLDDVQTRFFAAALSTAEACDASRPERILRDAEVAASHSRIIAADHEASRQRLIAQQIGGGN